MLKNFSWTKELALLIKYIKFELIHTLETLLQIVLNPGFL